MQKFRDPQNQKEEIIQRIAKMVPSENSDENKTQILHKYIDFQLVTLGQKIRNIYEFIVENSEDFEKMDAKELTEVNLEEFEYFFDDLSLAQLMIQDDSNPNFYNIETV